MATNARLEELKKKFDENPRRYFAPLANEYRKQGDLTQAITLCRAHLPNQPGHISGHIVLAQALYEARELPESRQIFEQALELDPENLIALRSLGDIARAQDDVGAARSWYERVLDADPRNDEITTLLRELAAEQSAVGAPAVDSPVAEAVEEAEPAEAAAPEAPVPAWDPDKTPVANIAIVEPPVVAAMPEVPAVEDTADIFGNGTVDQGAELLDVFEPTESAAPAAFQAPEASEETPVEAFELELPALTVDELAPATEAPAVEEVVEAVAEPQADVSETTDAPAVESEFVEDVSAFAVAQELSDPEALPEPMTDDWFNAPTPPRGVARQYEAELTAAAEAAQAPQQTLQIPTPAEGAVAQSTSVDLGTFDLIDTGAATEGRHAADSQPAEEEHPASWFDAPVVSSAAEVEPESRADEVTEEELVEAEAPVEQTPTYEAPLVTKFDEMTDVQDAWAEEVPAVEAAAAAVTEEFEASPVAAAELESIAVEEIPEQVAPPTVELEQELEPEAIDRGMTDQEDVFGSISLEEEPGAVEAEIPADMALASTLADPTLGRMAPETDMAESETPQMFVTETMAELYLQQGFADEALGIYRKLLEQNPGDEGIQARIVALETGAVSTVEAAADAAHLIDRHGQSVRTFFGRVASHRPRRRATVASSALDVSTLEAQYANRPGASEFEVQPSALSKLFAAAPQVPADDAAATHLASAFSSDAVGRPTRAADSELSLDHLFRDVPQEPSSAVTLDAFFAAPGGEAASPEADGAAPEERTGDIEQFTAWLEGLKKK